MIKGVVGLQRSSPFRVRLFDAQYSREDAISDGIHLHAELLYNGRPVQIAAPDGSEA